MLSRRFILIGIVLLSFSPIVSAQVIPADQYSLTALVGEFSWGYTDWNAHCSGTGLINNVTDLSAVETILSDGYADDFRTVCPATPPFNGIYNWPNPSNPATYEFAIAGGTNAILDELRFISSRSYNSSTSITVQYSLDGGPWTTAATTTAGTLGIVTGSAATYSLPLGGVQADRFRLTLQGDQVSVHEIIVLGQGRLAVPALGSWGVIAMTLLLASAALLTLRMRQG
jgi:hypothetical protein